MHERVVGCLKRVKLGEPQFYMNIGVFPIIDKPEGTVSYITMTEALERKLLTVTEVTQGGSVPELKVTNSGDIPVLLLDGEELAGAKQNRVLNTTVLVPEKQTIVIPVSCTEHGRWTYATPTFYDSGTVMTQSIRARKNRSVSESLSTSATFRSDQGEVWNGISDLQEAACSSSPTTAMRDVFESQRTSLEESLQAFPLTTNQTGILVVINGRAVGFDLVSMPAAFVRLHAKLIKSYVMDALLDKKTKKKGTSAKAMAKTAQEFMEQSARCEEKVFKSVGYGDDYRFKGDHIAGSALVHSGTVIHTAFFHLAQTSDSHMSGVNQRRANRVY